MEINETKPGMGSDVFDAPFSPDKLPGLLASYAAGWMLLHIEQWSWFVVAGILTLWELLETRGKTRSREHWLWLAGLWCSVLYVSLQWHVLPGDVHVWTDSGLPVLMPFLLAPYWVLCCSGLMAEAGSSGWLPYDLLRAWLIYPFRWFLARMWTMCRGVGAFFSLLKDGQRRNILYGMLTFGIASVFLLLALNLLKAADEGFAQLMDGLMAGWKPWQISGRSILHLILSLPVGAYLYSLISCSLQGVDRLQIEESKTHIRAQLAHCRRLPMLSWYVVMAAFVMLYLLFFGVQASELLGVFSSRLAPGGLTMSQFAVQGFWELCMLMALNLALLLTAHTFALRPLIESRAGKLLMTGILGESLLFALSAAAKVWLYVAAFGLTPLRLQGSWAILELSAGCICCLVWLWTGRKTTRWWCLFSGVTLILTLLL